MVILYALMASSMTIGKTLFSWRFTLRSSSISPCQILDNTYPTFFSFIIAIQDIDFIPSNCPFVDTMNILIFISCPSLAWSILIEIILLSQSSHCIPNMPGLSV